MTVPETTSPKAGTADVEELLAGLYGAAHAVRDHLRDVLDRVDLSAPTFWTLHYIVVGGPRNVGQVAAACVVTPAQVSNAVEELVAEGLVRRERATRDRRVVVLSPTPRGRTLHQTVWTRVSSRLAERLGGLGADEIGTATHVLHRLTRPPPPPAPHREAVAA